MCKTLVHTYISTLAIYIFNCKIFNSQWIKIALTIIMTSTIRLIVSMSHIGSVIIFATYLYTKVRCKKKRLQNRAHHDELKREKKNPISNVCLGGCTITSKAKINVFLKNFFTPDPPRGPSTQINFKNVDFSLWGKQCIVLPKWTFFRVLAHCVIYIL